MSSKLTSLLLGATAAVALAAAAEAQTRGGTVTIAQTQQPPSLDAHVTSAQAARNINLQMYETLYARDENAAPVPDLAAGVDISEDGLTYVFTLREGVRFHDGSTLDSEDVVASLERYRRVGASASLLDAIDTIEATGPLEVTVTLTDVQASFLDNLSSPRAPIAIIPAEQAAKGANEIDFIGTGPFRFVEYVPDSHVTLARFDDYTLNTAYEGRDGFAGKKEVWLDGFTIRFMPEAGARMAALESGQVDLLETVDGPNAERLRGNPSFEVIPLLPWAFQVAKFNHALAPTNDVNFRRAVYVALDMEEIMEIAFPDINQLEHGWIYPNSPYFAGDIGADMYNQRDLERAKEYLAQSSYNGERLTFIVDNNRPNVDTATLVQQQLAELGIEVDISVADWPTTSRIGFTDEGWNFWAHGFGIEPYEGPYSIMLPWVNGSSQRVDDPEINDLYAKINAEMDLEKRVELFAAFQEHMFDQAVVMKLGNYGLFQVASSRVQNFAPYRIPRMWGVWVE